MTQELNYRRFDAVMWSLSLAFLIVFMLYTNSGHAAIPRATTVSAAL